jgi:hypothetical protein
MTMDEGVIDEAGREPSQEEVIAALCRVVKRLTRSLKALKVELSGRLDAVEDDIAMLEETVYGDEDEDPDGGIDVPGHFTDGAD